MILLGVFSACIWGKVRGFLYAYIVLKLNTDKTEMMLVSSSVRISSVGCESADIGGSTFPFQTSVTYLGVLLDQTLSMKQTHQ